MVPRCPKCKRQLRTAWSDPELWACVTCDEGIPKAHLLLGIITSQDGVYSVVTCDDAPAHLETIHLTRSQVNGATVGDKVELLYTSTARYGVWSVVLRFI